MAKPFTRAQQRQNAAFLRHLRRMGNVVLAARAAGLNPATFYKRRYADPAFAARWDAAFTLTLADRTPLPPSRVPAVAGAEPSIVVLKSGRCQIRRARQHQLDQTACQTFLLALSATANISLAAQSAGFAPAAFNRRRRRDPAFAREVLAALALGYERVEGALIDSFLPGDAAATAWRDNEPPALPPMTSEQAVQILYLKQKRVRWRETEWQRALLPGETSDRRSARLARLYRAKLVAGAEQAFGASAADEPPGADEPPSIVLPDLAQVTGWSKADPAKGGPNGSWGPFALFGGWRIKDMEAQSAAARDAERAEAARKEAETRAEMERGWAAVAARAEEKKGKRKRPG